jgi:hypothetical protein
LALLGGLLLVLGGTLVLVLRSGAGSPIWSAVNSVPVPAPTAHASEAQALDAELYWPPRPQPLAAPDAPGNLLWWDARFAYRRALLFDVVAQRAPPGSKVEVLWDGDAAVGEGKARADGADVRVAFCDGTRPRELARSLVVDAERRTWRITFALVDGGGSGVYHLYYGRGAQVASSVGGPSWDEDAEPPLTLALGDEEAVEWGPVVMWTADSATPQTLVSPDGRITFQHPAGGLRQDTRVRLRTVPESERAGSGALPDYEFHADPPPNGREAEHLVRWDPPVTVTINWAGARGSASSVRWVHFRYDLPTGTWNPVPIEFDAETGVMRFTTDQP